MLDTIDARRSFLKTATAGVAGAALIGLETRTFAQTARAAATSVFEVTAFGAKGDGKTVDTPAVNKAIDAAAAAGGGMVRFPAGTYLCYSIHLKNNVALYISQGATILAADSPAEGTTGQYYDLAESNAPWESYQDYGHNHWHNSLIWGEGLHDISIIGPGLIYGKGLSRGSGTGPKAELPGVANKTIALKNCRNVLLRDFSILQGGHFGLLATGVDNMTIDNLKIDTNRDGLDIDCCRNIRVSNCAINSPWDDGICPKSSFALGYARATEMLTIANCFVTGNYQLGTMLDGTYKPHEPGTRVSPTGRIKFGTESNGGFKNITVSNCVFDGCRGLALEAVDGALLEDITISNITMRDIFGAPIFMRLGARMRGPAGVAVGQLRRVTISNIVCSNATANLSSIISGILGHPIEDLRLSSILVLHQGGGTQEDAALQVPEKEDVYPEPTMFGRMPAHGFFMRHIKGLRVDNVEVRYEKEDLRPAFVLDHVVKSEFFRVDPQHAAGVPAFVLNNVQDFSLYRSKPLPDTELDKVTRKEI